MSTSIPSQYLPLFKVSNVIVFPIVTVMGEGRYRNLYFSSIAVLFVISTSMVAVETAQALRRSVVTFESVRTQDFPSFLKFEEHDATKTIIYVPYYILPVAAKQFHGLMMLCCVGIHQTNPSPADSYLIRCEWFDDKCSLQLGFDPIDRIKSYPYASTLQSWANVVDYSKCQEIKDLPSDNCEQDNVRPFSSLAPAPLMLTHYSPTSIESGMIYPVTLIVHLSIVNGFPHHYAPLETLSLVVIAAGIAPTLIIVRLRLGISAPDAGTVKQPPRSSISLDSIQPTQRSIYFSAANRRLSRLEGIQVKPPPAVHKTAHSI
ncbi:hypothetical protein L218DRAFT_1026654 [Marasmius fiardii PR-910]|nr:hypothetical protein L218DRAFT_1026654 [Marasmius fiardii PR-910]